MAEQVRVEEDDWTAMPAMRQRALADDLPTIDHEDGLLRRLQEHWGLDRVTVVAVGWVRLNLPVAVGGWWLVSGGWGTTPCGAASDHPVGAWKQGRNAL